MDKYSIPVSLSVDEKNVSQMFSDMDKSRLSCPQVCPSLIDGKEANFIQCPKADDENNPTALTISTQNCSQFLKYRGYILQSMSKEEEEFPVAFSILVYCCPHQVEALLRAIYRPQNYYCIHIDSKCSGTFKKCMRSLADCLPNVFIATKLERVKWGSFGVVAAELSCMKDLLRYKKWKYLINLTGQEFPLKTNLQIVRILKILNGANDINAKIIPKKRFRILFNYDDEGRVIGKKEPLPFNMTFLSGSTHITATREFVNFTINNPKAQVYIKWVNGTKIPDETVFSILNGNPQFGVPGAYKGPLSSINDVPFLSRYKIWSDDVNGICGGYFRRGVCVFGPDDLPQLVNRFELFANKFTGNDPHQVITRRCLDEWLFNRTKNEYLRRYAFDLRPYPSLPQVYP